jgi:hypothetical protein
MLCQPYMHATSKLAVIVALAVVGISSHQYKADLNDPVDREISELAKVDTHHLAILKEGQCSLMLKILGISDVADWQTASDKADAVIKNRKQLAINGRLFGLSPRDEALAVLQMPSSTPNAILRHRLKFIDETLLIINDEDPRHAHDYNYFAWFPHSY